jgi:hypothetical protein
MRIAAGILASAACLSCAGSEATGDLGLEQPIRLENGQLVPGALPGVFAEAAAPDAGSGPRVIDVTIASRVIEERQAGSVLSGHATTDAQSVAVRFADLGSAYWVVPTSAPDPSDNGLLTWQLTADFGADLPPGFHDLRFAAIDENGESGTQFDLPVCVDTPVPDNLNACAPSRVPPAAVISLSWDSPVDLDLIVQTPGGTTIGGKNAGIPAADGGAPPKGSGQLDRDSNRNCAIDGIQREDIVWQAAPPSGIYQVWADLFSACHQPAVTFTVSLWLPETQPDGTQRLVEQRPPIATGEIVASQANGGAGPGLFVGDFILR